MSFETETESKTVTARVLYVRCNHCHRRVKEETMLLEGWLCCHLMAVSARGSDLAAAVLGAAVDFGPTEQHLCDSCRKLFERFLSVNAPALSVVPGGAA